MFQTVIFHLLETNLCQAIIVVWREMKMDRCGYVIPGKYISNFIMIGCKSLRHNTSKCKYSTDKTQPNRKQTHKTPDLLFVSAQGLFLVRYGGPRADPRLTQGKHRMQTLILGQVFKLSLKNDQISFQLIWNIQEAGLQAVRKRTDLLHTSVHKWTTRADSK